MFGVKSHSKVLRFEGKNSSCGSLRKSLILYLRKVRPRRSQVSCYCGCVKVPFI